MSRPSFSFEFFPPKTDAAAAQLWAAMPELAVLGPKYMTVTYGAGGSTRDGTYATLMRAKEFGIPLASHLTFVNATRLELYDLTDRLWNDGIRHIVALRGDMPKDVAWPLDKDGDYFQFTSDFVAGLRARRDFEVSVAAYPEKHPDAPDMDADIAALRKKCDAGATRAITQFFFENEKFYAFREKCAAAGIRAPVYPGLLPVHDFKSMVRFAERCKAGVPAWLHDKFAGLENSPAEARKIAEDILTRQVLDLAVNGVSHMHIYTLNKADITKEACKALLGTV